MILVLDFLHSLTETKSEKSMVVWLAALLWKGSSHLWFVRNVGKKFNQCGYIDKSFKVIYLYLQFLSGNLILTQVI